MSKANCVTRTSGCTAHIIRIRIATLKVPSGYCFRYQELMRRQHGYY